MKALVYQGPRDVRIMQVPNASIQESTDVLVQITTTNICGSDLHMYEGRTNVEQGKVLGHENLGRVIEVGPAVRRVTVGDMVCLPFNISCGFYTNCEQGYTGVLPRAESRSRRGSIRVCGDGLVSGWAGRISARALRRFQLLGLAGGCFPSARQTM